MTSSATWSDRRPRRNVGRATRRVLENVVHGVETSTDGWRDDDQAFLHDWGSTGLDAGPVAVWFGDQDLMVPARHGEWLGDSIPGARARRFPDDGHLTLALNRHDEQLDELLDLAGGKW